jgi:acetyltransferase-like isoleucine patch superfamily enzyme
MSGELWVVGCGRVFEAIALSGAVFAADGALRVLRLSSADAIAGASLAELPAPPCEARLFVAVDQSALNFARFDLYGRMRIAGHRFRTLVHPSANVDPSAELGENCWVGPGAMIGPQVKVGHNTFVGAAALVESGAALAANVWVGAAARIGADASIGTHSVLGADVRVGNAVAIGRHCSIETPGHYLQPLPDRTFIDPLFALPVRIYSAGPAAARRKV